MANNFELTLPYYMKTETLNDSLAERRPLVVGEKDKMIVWMLRIREHRKEKCLDK